MSRSYKHTPFSGDRKGKIKKRFANKTVRQWLKSNLDNELQRNDYKKIYDSWEICDYYNISSWEEYWDSIVKHWYEWRYMYEPFPDKEKEYQKYLRYYKRK